MSVVTMAPSLRTLLEENAAEMSQLRTSHIFMPAAGANFAPIGSSEAPVLSAEVSTNPLQPEVTSLREQVAELREQLEEAHKRSATIADCQRRENEIHSTLLRAAHDEAVQARRDVEDDASSLRARLGQAEVEVASLRAQLDIQRQTAYAEAGLQAAETAKLRKELVGGQRDGAASAAGVHLALLRSELAVADRNLATASASLAGRAEWQYTAPQPSKGPALDSIQRWSASDLEGGGAPPQHAAATHGAGALERLERLESIANMASERFEALRREHSTLRRRFVRLQQRSSATAGKEPRAVDAVEPGDDS
jgi:hypothetical protein